MRGGRRRCSSWGAHNAQRIFRGKGVARGGTALLPSGVASDRKLAAAPRGLEIPPTLWRGPKIFSSSKQRCFFASGSCARVAAILHDFPHGPWPNGEPANRQAVLREFPSSVPAAQNVSRASKFTLGRILSNLQQIGHFRAEWPIPPRRPPPPMPLSGSQLFWGPNGNTSGRSHLHFGFLRKPY